MYAVVMQEVQHSIIGVNGNVFVATIHPFINFSWNEFHFIGSQISNIFYIGISHICAKHMETDTSRLRDEVRQYSPDLAKTPHVALLSKRDLLPAGEALPALDAPEAQGILAVSSVAGTGVEELKEYLWKFVQEAKAQGRTGAAAQEGDVEEGEYHLEADMLPTHDARGPRG